MPIKNFIPKLLFKNVTWLSRIVIVQESLVTYIRPTFSVFVLFCTQNKTVTNKES